MGDIPLGKGLFYIFGFIFASYVWARVVSLAVFTSWSQVCSFRCENCLFLNQVRSMENEKETKKETGCQEQKEKEQKI